MRKSESYFVKFVSARNKFLFLCGGVLLSLIFSLCPNNASALTYFTAPSADVHFSQFEHNAMRGCAMRDYDLINGIKFRGGLSHEHSSFACSWSMVNGHLLQQEQSYNSWRTWKNYSGASQYQDRNTFSGSRDYSNSPVNLGPMMTGITLNITKDSDSIDFNMPPLIGSVPDNKAYATFVYAFSYNSNEIHNALPPVVDTSYYHIYVRDWSNNDLSSEILPDSDGRTYLEEAVFDINSTTNLFCTINNQSSSGGGELPSLLDDSTLEFLNNNYGDNSCFLFYAIPIYPDRYVSLQNGYIQFKYPNKNIHYVYKDWVNPFEQNEFDLPTIALTPMAYADGYFYGKIGVSEQSLFSPINPSLTAYIPTTTSEYADVLIRVNRAKELNYSISNAEPASLNASSSYYMNWFNIFSFGFTYPLTAFLTSFTDSTSCVNLPIIGGMLNNPNVRYCSWFSNDVRSILTPVISLFSIVVITGFVVHWLSGSRHITMNGGTE